MTGLHDRYPSYFYKRGNLFNTYLSHTDAPSSGPGKAKPKEKVQPSVTPQTAVRRDPDTAGARLAAFARSHLSYAETARLGQLIAADRHISIDDRTGTHGKPVNLMSLVDLYVEPELAAKYLKTLQRRLERGEPLIQK